MKKELYAHLSASYTCSTFKYTTNFSISYVSKLCNITCSTEFPIDPPRKVLHITIYSTTIQIKLTILFICDVRSSVVPSF